MREIKISVYSVIGNSFCIDTDDGEKIYTLINKAIINGQKVKLSFQNIELVTSAFLNVAIGQLYRDFDEASIRKAMSVENISDEDIALLRRVVKTAKIFYKDPERLSKALDEMLGEYQ